VFCWFSSQPKKNRRKLKKAKTNRHAQEKGPSKHIRGKKSKFFELYGDRVKSIRNTDANIKRNKLKAEIEENNKNMKKNMEALKKRRRKKE
jgi:hypothetical protein